MISFQQFRRFFLNLSLTTILVTAIAFSFGSEESWATVPLTQLIHQQPIQIANMNRAKAMTKDLEGKTQETMGNITGNRKDQIMGKAKQVEGKVRNSAEDLKDNMKLKGRTKAISKNIEGKAQEAKGNITGDRGDQIAGKAKQAEGETRSAFEDAKDNIQSFFN
jgi:uncharacterized protein YjbJ (UPF0337 family)